MVLLNENLVEGTKFKYLFTVIDHFSKVNKIIYIYYIVFLGISLGK